MFMILYTLVCLTLMSHISFAEEQRYLRSAWENGTGPASGCTFKTLAEIFPSTQNAVFEEKQSYTFTGTNTNLPTGSYTGALMYGQYERKFVADANNPIYAEYTDATPSYKYYVRGAAAWVSINSDGMVGKTTPSTSFAYERFTLRAPTYSCANTEDDVDSVQQSMMGSPSGFNYLKKEKCIKVTYGMLEQIPARSWLLGAASTCSQNQHSESNNYGESDDIFVWAKYTFPAFSYTVNKNPDETVVKMNVHDENEEILLVYGDQSISDNAVEQQVFSTLNLGVGNTEVNCNVAISWSTDQSTSESNSTAAPAAPYECYVNGASTTNAVPNQIDTSCKAGSVMTCTVTKKSATSARESDYSVTLDTSVAVLEMVKLANKTKGFPYDSMEAFVDDHDSSTDFVTKDWYLPGNETVETADPYTVLSFRSVTTSFTCPLEVAGVDCECDTTNDNNPDYGQCVDSLKTISDLGTNVELLRSNWPGGSNVEYPSVYISMIASASLTFDADPVQEFNDQQASDADFDPKNLTQGDGTFGNGYYDLRVTVAGKRDAVDLNKETLANATADLENAIHAELVASLANVTASDVADGCFILEDESNDCSTTMLKQCIDDCGILNQTKIALAAAMTLKTTATSTKAAAVLAVAGALGELTTAVTNMQNFEDGLHYGNRTSASNRRLRAKHDIIATKSIIIGQQYGNYKQL